MNKTKGNKPIMTKCDFCIKSSPSGKCSWAVPSLRESDCEKAIKKMVEALKGTNTKNKG